MSSTAEDEAAAAEPTNSGLLTLIVPTKAAQYIASLPPDEHLPDLVSRDYEPSRSRPIDPTARSRPRTPRC